MDSWQAPDLRHAAGSWPSSGEPASEIAPELAPPAAEARAPKMASAAPSSEAAPEEQALEAVRSALRRGEPSRALEASNAYLQRYPQGSFAVEAALLRIEVLRASGKAAEARAFADEFIRQHPDHPLRERLRDAAAQP